MTNEPDTLPPDAERVRAGLLATAAAVAKAIPGRRQMADALALALASGEHVLTDGEPGTGKSLVIETFLRGFSATRLWQYQGHAESSVQDLIGPLSIAALRDRDERIHNTSKQICNAEIVYLDELGKMPQGTINTLCSVLNERTWAGSPIPLWTVCAATNESIKKADDAGALSDRFLFQLRVQPLSDADFAEALDVVYDETGTRGYVPPVALSAADLQVSRAAIRAVRVPTDVKAAIAEIRAKLGAAGTKLSDRRYIRSVRAVQTAAYLAGDTTAELDHFDVLSLTLGGLDPEAIARVEALTKTFRNGLYLQGVSIADAAISKFAARGDHVSAKTSQGIFDAVQNAISEIQTLVRPKSEAHLRSRAQGRAAEKLRPRSEELMAARKTMTAEIAARGIRVAPDASGI